MRHHFEALELKHVQPAVAQIGSDFEIFTPKHNQNSEMVYSKLKTYFLTNDYLMVILLF